MNEEITNLLEQLKSNDEVERRYALEDLSDLNDPGLVDIFIKYLSDPSTGVKEISIDALLNLKSEESVVKLIELLKSEDVPLRNASIEVLNEIAAINSSALIKALTDSDEDSLKFVLDILISNTDQISFAECEILTIKNLLGHTNQNVVGASSELLASIAPHDVTTYLEEMKIIQNGWVQYSVLHILKDKDQDAFSKALSLITNNYKTQESELIARKVGERSEP